MSEEKIRIGIIGAGDNTRKMHIPGFRAIPGVEISAVCNRTPESSRRAAEQFGIPHVKSNWLELAQAQEVDAVLIGTWPYLHCRATLAALGAGKHVLCEARMAMNAAEAQRMLAAARERPHLVAQVVPSPFTLHVDKVIQEMLAAGELGDLLAIEVRAGGGFLNPESPLHWRQDFDLSGFNTMSLGIWYEALMRWAGPARSVMAMGKTFVKSRIDAEGRLRAVRVPDHLNVIAEMVCGAHLNMQISSGTGLSGPPEAILYGERGTLRFVEKRLYFGRPGDTGLQEIEIPEHKQGAWQVETEFIGAIRGQERVRLTDFKTGVKYMEFTEAVARSMAKGREINLPLETS